MKRFWATAMMFNSFITLPASFIFLIYSFGAMILLGKWEWFLFAVVGFVFFCVVQAATGILSE